METRLTLRPGMPGTKKLVAHYGERLLCVLRHQQFEIGDGEERSE